MVRSEGLGKLKKSNNIIGIRTRDLAACNSTIYATAFNQSHYYTFLKHYGNKSAPKAYSTATA
jgi:hypothetical protein